MNSKKCVAFLAASSPGTFWHLGLRVDGGKVINFLAGCWWPSLTLQDLRQLSGRKSPVLMTFINSGPITRLGPASLLLVFRAQTCICLQEFGDPFICTMFMCVCV